MSASSVYSNQITEDERRLGFALQSVANPNPESDDDPKFVQAAVFPVGATARVVKLTDDAGGGYMLERCWSMQNPLTTDRTWQMDSRHCTAEEAIQAAADEPPSDGGIQPVNPRTDY